VVRKLTDPASTRRLTPEGRLVQPPSSDDTDAGVVAERLVLATLGRCGLDVLQNERRVEALTAGKPLALVVYLACAKGRVATRGRLVDLLWADLKPAAARHSVRHAIWFLRRRLGEGLIVARTDGLELAAPIESDYDAFLAAVDRGESERAVRLYGGEFLPGFVSAGGAGFEQWADVERLRLRRLFVRHAEAVARDWLAMGRHVQVQQLAARVRDADPADERGWRLVLEAQLAMRDSAGAEREAGALERLLEKGERPPEPATRALLEQARRASATVSRAPSPHSLAPELTGRGREFARVLTAWESARAGAGCHLHITGGPGLGKTRLLSDVQVRLRAEGARVVLVRAHARERGVPDALAAALASALADLPGSAAVSPACGATLVALNPSLSSRYGLAADRAADGETLRRGEVALRELLEAVADEQPVAVLIDDLHWIDEASRTILHQLLSSALAHAVLVVTSARPGVAGVGRVSAEVLTLAPLTLVDTTALLTSLARLPDEEWAEWFPAELTARTRGVPLHVVETLRLLIDLGVLVLEAGSWACSDQSALAAELDRGGAMTRRVQELARGPRWLLLMLSVGGAPLAAEVLVRIADRDLDAVQGDLQTLELRGLAMRDGSHWLPSHDEIAARVTELASPGEVRAANDLLGRHFSVSGRDDPHVLRWAGRHLAAAGDDRELGRVLTRRLQLQRRSRERRVPSALARELLGDLATPERVKHLVRQLPLHVRLGLVTPGRVAALAAAIVAVAGAVSIGAAALLNHPVPPPDAWLVLIRERPGDSLSGIEVPLRRREWEPGAPLDAAVVGRPIPALVVHGRPGGPTPGERGVALEDSSDVDLFVVRGDQGQRHVTLTPGGPDDPNRSPDGRSVALTVGSANGGADIAILEQSTGRVSRLTFDGGSSAPRWSPDGTRLAFLHIDRHGAAARRQACWITVDGTRSGCWGEVRDALGWHDPRQLLVVRPPGDSLALLDMTTGALHGLGAAAGARIELSLDGHWIACLCRRSETWRGAQDSWYVFPIDQVDRWRRVALPAVAPESLHVHIVSLAPRSRYIDRVEIIAPGDTLAAGSRVQLLARASDARGAEVPVAVAEWRSLDAGIATIDTSGVLTARRPGVVRVVVSAGGWRDAARSVVISGRAGPGGQTNR
jgi:DNA-binding SARP family transcriptional activator